MFSGGTLTISGSGFGSSGSVYLGSQELTVTSWTDSSIEVSADAVEAGDLELSVETNDGVAVDG